MLLLFIFRELPQYPGLIFLFFLAIIIAWATWRIMVYWRLFK